MLESIQDADEYIIEAATVAETLRQRVLSMVYENEKDAVRSLSRASVYYLTCAAALSMVSEREEPSQTEAEAAAALHKLMKENAERNGADPEEWRVLDPAEEGLLLLASVNSLLNSAEGVEEAIEVGEFEE